MIDEQTHDKIEAYLSGQMPAPEANAFEAELETNPELVEALAHYRIGFMAADRLVELEMRQKFRHWRSEMEPEIAPPQLPPKQISLQNFALILLLLLAGALLFWYYHAQQMKRAQEYRQQAEQALFDAQRRIEALEAENARLQETLDQLPQGENPGHQGGLPARTDFAALDLANKALSSYASELDEAVRSARPDEKLPGKNPLADANKAIKAKQFEQAEQILTAIKSTDTQYPRALEMLAYVYVQRRKFQQAVTTYQTYQTLDSDTDKTDWNLCLFYLADYPRSKTAFQTLLNKILADSGHTYYGRAKALRAELEGR